MDRTDDKIRVIVRNRKARHDFEIQSTLEAGMELKGSEVKSLRAGKVNLADAYAYIEQGQVFLRHLHISPYPMAAGEPPEPTRIRRLLLHKREIHKLEVQTRQKGMTLIPLAIYFKGKTAKVELALGIGRKLYDKRQAIAKREAQKRIEQAIRREKK